MQVQFEEGEKPLTSILAESVLQSMKGLWTQTPSLRPSLVSPVRIPLFSTASASPYGVHLGPFNTTTTKQRNNIDLRAGDEALPGLLQQGCCGASDQGLLSSHPRPLFPGVRV